MHGVKLYIDQWLGLGVQPAELTFVQIALRGIIVFLLALTMVRLGDKRFLSKKSAFDAILGFILASMLARAVNGSAAFWPTLGGGFVLVGIHRVLAMVARVSHPVGWLIKGRSELVIRDGAVQERALRKNDFSEHDLEEDLRLEGAANPSEVLLAYIERNGTISVVKKTK